MRGVWFKVPEDLLDAYDVTRYLMSTSQREISTMLLVPIAFCDYPKGFIRNFPIWKLRSRASGQAPTPLLHAQDLLSDQDAR